MKQIPSLELALTDEMHYLAVRDKFLEFVRQWGPNGALRGFSGLI